MKKQILATIEKLENKIAGALKSEKWVNHEFESSSSKTPEFKQFARDFLSDLKKLCEGYEIVNKNIGHFYVSGFLKKDDKFVYFSVSDVRHFPNEWFNKVLIRTAKNEKDYSGGSNKYTNLKEIKNSVDNLLENSKVATGYTEQRNELDRLIKKLPEADQKVFLEKLKKIDQREGGSHRIGITGLLSALKKQTKEAKIADIDMGQYDAIKKEKNVTSPFDKEHHSVSYESKSGEGFVVGYHYPTGMSGKRKEIYRVEMPKKDYEKKLKSIINRYGSGIEGAEQAFKAFKVDL
jgi:hypothetical protein